MEWFSYVFIEGIGEAKVSIATKQIPSLGVSCWLPFGGQDSVYPSAFVELRDAAPRRCFFWGGEVEQRAVLSCGQKGDQRRPKMTEGQICWQWWTWIMDDYGLSRF